MLYIPVPGTWTARETPTDDYIPWFYEGSPLDQRLRRRKCYRVNQTEDPRNPDIGFWSGDLEGTLITTLLDVVKNRPAQDKWWHGAFALYSFLLHRATEFRDQHVTILAHSHGGQVATRALAMYAEANVPSPPGMVLRLVTVDMPVRFDSYRYYEAAAHVCTYWKHLHTDWYTFMRFAGSLSYGVVPGPVRCKFADTNWYLTGGHSAALSDPAYMSQVVSRLAPAVWEPPRA